MSEKPHTTKGERTRARILQAALELFREQGFEESTVRDVAERAGVAVGSAYYYFESKEHLVQGFYAQTHVEHVAACESLLARESSLRARLRGVLWEKIRTAEPYHRLSAALFRSAADPTSPLSPFSVESARTREDAVELMRRVVLGSRTRIHKDLREELPRLLWLYEMGIILFWIHDCSPGRARTRSLIEHTAGLVARLVGMASLPLMGPIRKGTLRLLADLEPRLGGAGRGPRTP